MLPSEITKEEQKVQTTKHQKKKEITQWKKRQHCPCSSYSFRNRKTYQILSYHYGIISIYFKYLLTCTCIYKFKKKKKKTVESSLPNESYILLRKQAVIELREKKR